MAPVDFADVVEKVRPAVVSVRVKTEDADVANRDMPEGFDDLPPGPAGVLPPLRQMPPGDDGDAGDGREPFHPRRGMSHGSGFFISEDGYVVTNNHVVDGRQPRHRHHRRRHASSTPS